MTLGKISKNIFTIDTEEWFHVYYGAEVATPESWAQKKATFPAMVDQILELLDECKVVATFFVVGWLAKQYPALIRKLSERGHEIASHGFSHRPYHWLEETAIRSDVGDAKKALEDAIGKEVKGFRAPGFSIRESDTMIFNIIHGAGHRYDSSVFSGRHNVYMLPNGLIEVPPNCLGVNPWYAPTGGGFFFRFMPYAFYRQYVNWLAGKRRPLVFYTHTWELYTDYPRLPMSFIKKFIQYTNLHAVVPKTRALSQDFSFTTMGDFLATTESGRL